MAPSRVSRIVGNLEHPKNMLADRFLQRYHVPAISHPMKGGWRSPPHVPKPVICWQSEEGLTLPESGKRTTRFNRRAPGDRLSISTRMRPPAYAG